MDINLVEFRALEVQLVSTDLRNPSVFVSSGEDFPNEQYKFNYDIQYPAHSSREFAVIYQCGIRAGNLKFLQVFYLARFETREDITEDFKQSQFPGMNAPAIGFPYLRAYMSQVLLLSGYKPTLIPTINFQEMYYQRKKAAEAAALPEEKFSGK